MNVLLANKFFFLNGGSEKVFFQERDFLSRRGMRVIDFAMKDPLNFSSDYSSFFVSNINYHSTKGVLKRLKQGIRFVHSLEAVINLERLVERERPTIAHLHNIYHQLTPSIIHVLKNHGVKVVLTLHDGKLICPSYVMLNKGNICAACKGHYFWRPLTKRCQGCIAQELLLMIEAYWHKWKKSYELVDLFIAPSEFIAELTSLRIPGNKVKLLRNGVNIDELRPTYQDDGYGLYFGRLSKEKGIETLLEAHMTTGHRFHLKVMGTGPLEDELRKSYPNAEFLGYRHGKELVDIIANSTFVVVPSECYENCSMAVLEAMAMGKPIIGSKIGGIPEQVEDGKTGLLFEMGNVQDLAEKMKLMMENDRMRHNMGMAARNRVEKVFSLENHCRKLLEIYDGLLGEKMIFPNEKKENLSQTILDDRPGIVSP